MIAWRKAVKVSTRITYLSFSRLSFCLLFSSNKKQTAVLRGRDALSFEPALRPHRCRKQTMAGQPGELGRKIQQPCAGRQIR